MITPPSEKKLFLVDAYALIFRAYYAFIKNPRINTKGMNTSAVFGFTNALLEVIRSEQPTHLAVVFDPPGPTLRNEQFEDYKANRDETPEDIKLSVPWIVKILEGMRIPVLQAPGFEADDLIGCLAKRAEKEGFDVFMMTPDKDFAQLVTDKIRMFRPGRGGNPASVWGPEEVRERYGLEDPKQVIDLLGLMGDSADNIPGVPGVGEKTAIKFLQAYGSMEGLYEHVHELKGKMKEKVEANRELAFLSRELATIVLDIDFDEDFPAMALEPANADVLAPVLEELEFRTLSRRILGDVTTAPAPAASANPTPRSASNSQDSEGQLSMFDAAMDVAPAASTLGALDPDKVTYSLVDDDAGMKALVKTLTQAKRFAFDTETSGLNAMEASLVGMSFSAEAHTGSYVPVNPSTWPPIRDIFKPLLEDPKLTIVGQNLKYDGKIMARHGVDLTQANLEDTMVAHYLLEPDQPHGMDALAQAFLDYQCIPITDLLGKKGKNQKSMADIPPSEVVNYACEDADITLQLADVLIPKLEEEGLTALFRDVEMPLLSVLMDMELEGVALDTAHLAQFSDTLAQELDALQQSIQGHAGVPFNVDSPKQLGDVLFEHLEIPAKVKKTKTGQYPTSEAVLSKLKDKHPIVGKVLEYRKLKKLRSTYVEPLPSLLHPETGRVHTTYMQVVAATGRLSSKDPNLQNIPIRTAQGREIRKAFVPRSANHVLVAADYSQVELRIAAAMSEEQGLIEAFQKGEDIHAATAAKVFGVPLDEVSREQRSQAKAVNFGILYGQGAFGLAENLGISRKEAKAIIEAYHSQFSGLEAFTQTCVAQAREAGYATTLLGRRRPLPDIHSNNAVVRAFAERNAVNTPIQGSAADIIKVAMIEVDREMKGMESKLIMQVHDELVVDAVESELDDVKALLVRCMERAVKLSVPLDVEVSHGQTWLEAH
ncbi:MAG: DNA polymerase I [Flavobacteriales bacterium]|nr:DNA polymerase I [Flavobacteriales bacterium]